MSRGASLLQCAYYIPHLSSIHKGILVYFSPTRCRFCLTYMYVRVLYFRDESLCHERFESIRGSTATGQKCLTSSIASLSSPSFAANRPPRRAADGPSPTKPKLAARHVGGLRVQAIQLIDNFPAAVAARRPARRGESSLTGMTRFGMSS